MAALKLKGLQMWCKRMTDGYRDVSVTNMTVAWRSGMAFCALIHRFRPDLIDYDSLQKEDVYENNHMAFTVAKEKLGIPALLDAEDMVMLSKPDKLSIITYVSQYYNYFRDKTPGPSPEERIFLKPAPNFTENTTEAGGPSIKKAQANARWHSAGKRVCENSPPSPRPDSRRLNNEIIKTAESPPAKRRGLQTSQTNNENYDTLSDRCTICKKKVYLLERHMERGKMFHRTCYREKHQPRKPKPYSSVLLTPVKTNSNSEDEELDLDQMVERNADVASPPKDKERTKFFGSPKSSGSSPQSPPPVDNSFAVSPQRAKVTLPQPRAPSPPKYNEIVAQSEEYSSPPKPARTFESTLVTKKLREKKEKSTDDVEMVAEESVKPKSSLWPWQRAAEPEKEKTLEKQPAKEKSRLWPWQSAPKEADESIKSQSSLNSSSLTDSDSPVHVRTLILPTSDLDQSPSSNSSMNSSPLKSRSGTENVSATSSEAKNSPLKSNAKKSATPLGGLDHSGPEERGILSGLMKSLQGVRQRNSQSEEDPPNTSYDNNRNKPNMKPATSVSNGHGSPSSTRASPSRNVNEKTHTTEVKDDKPQWQVEAEKRQAARQGRYNDPEKKYLLKDSALKTPEMDRKVTSIDKPSNNRQSNLSPSKPALGGGYLAVADYSRKKPELAARNVNGQQNENNRKSEQETKAEIELQNKRNTRDLKVDIAKVTENKPQWQLEAEKRAKARQKGGYVDPEKKYLYKDRGDKTPGSAIDNTDSSWLVDTVNKQMGGPVSGQNKPSTPATKGQPSSGFRPSSSSTPSREVRSRSPQGHETTVSSIGSPGRSHVTNNDSSPKLEWQVEAEKRRKSRDTNLLDPEEARNPPAGSPYAKNEESGRKKILPHYPIRFDSQSCDFDDASNSMSPRSPSPPTPATPSPRGGRFNKPPAPGIPMPPSKRKVSPEFRISTKVLKEQLKELDRKQTELERIGRKLEDKIRQADPDILKDLAIFSLAYGEAVEDDDNEDELLIMWFELVNEKNNLVRAECELMYIQKQQQLEEQHADIEYEIRVLMNKSDALKTDVDRAREEELLHQLIMVVEQRNKVVDNIDEDRIRYEEEDRQIEEILYNKGIRRESNASIIDEKVGDKKEKTPKEIKRDKKKEEKEKAKAEKERKKEEERKEKERKEKEKKEKKKKGKDSNKENSSESLAKSEKEGQKKK